MSIHESEDKSARRRGRKRGKHNFEPGYKEMLFKEWAHFTQKHSRCPKTQEIQSISDKCFKNRRKDLEAEDPNHPLLVILEEPLDAVQVKNLFNNEKKKKKRQAAANASVAFPFNALQGLPLSEAAVMMHGWLQNAAAQHQEAKPKASKAASHAISKDAGHVMQQEPSAASEASCRASDKFASPLSFPLTPQSIAPPQALMTSKPFNLANDSLALSLDHNAEDDNDIKRDYRSSNRNRSELSGITSAAIASLVDASTDASSHPKPLDRSRIRQSTVGEVISMALLRHQGQAESPSPSGPVHFVDSPIFSPKTPPLQALPVPPLSIMSGTALDCIRAHAKATNPNSTPQTQNVCVSITQLQELVKTAVDEQVRMRMASVHPKPRQPELPAWWQQERSPTKPAPLQIDALMDLMQEYQQRRALAMI